MSWAGHVEGRSIAVVGPAPLDADYSDQIEAHDLVYRLGFHDRTLPGTGRRTDIVFLNGRQGREHAEDTFAWERAVADTATWWVFKQSNRYRPNGLHRTAARPSIRNPNQATHALFDLLQYDTGPITVFGVDLYSGGPQQFYNTAYAGLTARPVESHAEAFLMHRPFEQLRFHRRFIETGRIVGTPRYLKAATMTDDDYRPIVEAWQAVIAPAEPSLSALT